MIEIISHSLEEKTFKIVSSDINFYKIGEIISLDLYCKIKRSGYKIKILKKSNYMKTPQTFTEMIFDSDTIDETYIPDIQVAILEQFALFNDNFKKLAVITDDNSVPTALEKIVHTLQDLNKIHLNEMPRLNDEISSLKDEISILSDEVSSLRNSK